MAGAVQWTVDRLYAGLRDLYSKIMAVQRELDADKADLSRLWRDALTSLPDGQVGPPDPATIAANRALLTKLIHQNTVLRLNYLQPIKQNYVRAVDIASATLRAAGYTTPTLAGPSTLGFVFAIAPVAAVMLVVLALAAVASVAYLTSAQRANVKAAADIINGHGSAEEKMALLAALTAQTKADAKAHPPLGFDPNSLILPLGILAVILVAPKVLDILPRRRAAA